MESLAKLGLALIENDTRRVSDFMNEIDLKTGGIAMCEAGKTFGFPTIVANGVTWTHLGMLSEILGYTNISGAWKLVEKYRLMTAKIGWLFPEIKTRAREIFNLSEKDSQAMFVTWDTILVLGMCGRGEKSEKVKLYLLEAERSFRLGTGKDVSLTVAKVDHYRLKIVKEELTIMKMVDQMRDGHFKLAAIELFEKATGREYPGPKQLALDFLKKESMNP
jgi:hypothetical protein